MAKITCSIGSKSSGSGTSPNVKSEIGNIHVWLVVCMYMCISVQIAKVYIRCRHVVRDFESEAKTWYNF